MQGSEAGPPAAPQVSVLSTLPSHVTTPLTRALCPTHTGTAGLLHKVYENAGGFCGVTRGPAASSSLFPLYVMESLLHAKDNSSNSASFLPFVTQTFNIQLEGPYYSVSILKE